MHWVCLCKIILLTLYPVRVQNKYMPNIMTNAKVKDKIKTIVVEKVAEKHRVKTNLVYKVLRLERVNEPIEHDFLIGQEMMLKAVNELFPFNS